MGDSNTSTTATGAKKSIVVSTDDGDVTVRRLPLVEYAALLRAFKNLPAGLGTFIDGNGADEFKNSSTAEMINKLLPLLEDSWTDFVSILALPTDKDAEFIGGLDAGDSMEVLAAVLDLNNYKKVLAAIKKLRAPLVTEKAADPAPATPTEA